MPCMIKLSNCPYNKRPQQPLCPYTKHPPPAPAGYQPYPQQYPGYGYAPPAQYGGYYTYPGPQGIQSSTSLHSSSSGMCCYLLLQLRSYFCLTLHHFIIVTALDNTLLFHQASSSSNSLSTPTRPRARLNTLPASTLHPNNPNTHLTTGLLVARWIFNMDNLATLNTRASRNIYF